MSNCFAPQPSVFNRSFFRTFVNDVIFRGNGRKRVFAQLASVAETRILSTYLEPAVSALAGRIGCGALFNEFSPGFQIPEDAIRVRLQKAIG